MKCFNSVLLTINVLQAVERNVVSPDYISILLSFGLTCSRHPYQSSTYREISWKCEFTLESTRSLKLTVTHSLTPIIICRFTLDLRQVSLPRGASLSSKHSVSLRFVGNAGGSLQFGADEGEEDEENTVNFPRAG